MEFYSLNPLSLLSAAVFFAGVIALILVRSKNLSAKEKIGVLGSNNLILRASDSFQKELEYLIKQEMQKNLSEIKKRNLDALEKIIKEMEFSMSETRKTINLEEEKIKKEMLEISKSAAETKNRFAQEAQKNISALTVEINKKLSDLSGAGQAAEKTIVEEAKKRAAELSRDISGEMSKTYKSAEETLAQIIKDTQKEIENYKWEKMKEVDQKIYKILIEISKDVIGKAIDFSTHEELIIQALNQAKKDGLLGS